MVGTMIVGYLAGASAATVAASFALTAAAFAVNFAVSMIVTRIFADNPEAQQDMGVRQQVPPSAVNALPVVYGEAYMGGTFVDAVLSYPEQNKMYYVLAISSISPNGQFTFDQTEMYYGDQKIIFDGTEPGKVSGLSDEATPTPHVNEKIAGSLFIYLFTSSQSGVITPINSSGALPSSIMGGSDIQASQRWPSTGRQMNGTAFAIVVMYYNREADTTALQPITFKVKHALNGTGVAKPGDVWYDYITNPVYGGAVDTAFVDSTCVTTLNTYSDELITFDDYDGNPQTQARYRINGVLDAGQSVLSNIDRIMSACDSWMAYNAALGQWSVVVNQPQATSYAFNDDNIIGEIRVSATDITSSINQVEARFPFKENRDQAAFVNLELQTLNPSLLYPNEPVNKYSITYDLVNDSVQANYLANRLLEQGREDLIVSFSTTYYGIQVNAGDVVSVTNADYGWSSKLFRVMKVNEASLPDGSLGAKLELNEYSAAVYDNFDITQYSPVPNSGLPSASYFSPLAAPTVTGYPSATFPHFDVVVYVPATGRVTFGNLFYTTSATPSSSDWKLLATASTANSEPVTNGSYYTFSNQTLGAGTYYFAYLVGNDVSQSILSPISSSLVWSPVGGTTGPAGPTGPTGTGTAGNNGLTALTAYKVQAQNAGTPTFTTPTSGATAPSGWTLTAPSVAVGQVMWYIQGKYNSNSVTVDGVAANTTAWTGPVAASIFQDIRSDNWNGSTPPTYGTTGTYGTQGYYIQQSTGDVFFNSGVFRADIQTDGDGSFRGNNPSTTFPIIVNGVSYTTDYSVYGQGSTVPTSGAVRVGVYGTATALGGSYNVGVLGYAQNGLGAKGVGVVGSGWQTGVYGSGDEYGLIGVSAGVTPVGLWIQSGYFKWGGFNIAAPAGSTSTFLRNDGTWAPASGGGGGTVTSVSGTGTVSGLTLSGTVTTSGSLTLGGTLSLTSSNVTTALGYTPLATAVTSVSGTGSVSGLTLSGTVTSTGNLTLGGSLSVSQANLIASAPGTAYYLSGSGWTSTTAVMSLAGTNSGTATVSGNTLNILGSTSTGIAGAYVGSAGAGNTVTLDVRTTSPSDVRLKEEIADSDLGLEFVKKLRPVSYKLKADPRHQKGYGFIANEVEDIIPTGSSLVYEEPDWKVGDEVGFKTIHYPSYVAVLTKAIQELTAKVEALEAKLKG